MAGALKTWLPVLALLAPVGLLQDRLDRRPERVAQRELDQVEGLPPGKVAEYVGMLFLGGLKPVVVNTLWMRYQDATGDRQWFEALEIMNLLAHLQPYNEQIWAHLSWDLGYNLAHETESAEERYQFILQGIRFAEQGARRNPRSAYLGWWCGFMYWHRSMFYEDFSLRLERETGKSAFLKAIDWFRESLARVDPSLEYLKTQGGYVWAPQDSDADVRSCLFLHGVVNALARDDYAEAEDYVRRAAEQNNRMMEKYRGKIGPAFPKRLAEFFPKAVEVLEQERKLAGILRQGAGVPVEERRKVVLRVLRAYDGLLTEYEGLDEGRLERRYRWIGHPLGLDRYEPNPKSLPTPLGAPGVDEEMSLGPLWDDEDWFTAGGRKISITVTPTAGSPDWAPHLQVFQVRPDGTLDLPKDLAPLPGQRAVHFGGSGLNRTNYRIRIYDPAAAEGSPLRKYQLKVEIQ